MCHPSNLSKKDLKLKPPPNNFWWIIIIFWTLSTDFGLDILAPGPYGLIFSSFVPFFFDIPVSSRFRVFGINFSDKSLTYLAGLQVNYQIIFLWSHLDSYLYLSTWFFLQLLFSSWKRSFLPGVCGILAGSLYRLNLFGIRRAKVFFNYDPMSSLVVNKPII